MTPNRYPSPLLVLCAALLIAVAAGCGKSSGDDDAGGVDAGQGTPDAGDLPDAGAADASVPDAGATAPLLDSTHPGWTGTNCFTSGCHTEAALPKPPHVAGTPVPSCSTCHGANGACDPNGGSKTNHTSAMSCTGCHSSQHGYSANADCVSCHYATVGGRRDCTP